MMGRWLVAAPFVLLLDIMVVGQTARRPGTPIPEPTPTPTPAPTPSPSEAEFNLWVISDLHLGADIAVGREALGNAIDHVLDGQYAWPVPDAVLMLGDVSASQTAPTDAEGAEYIRQASMGGSSLPITKIYSLAGNHDASIDQAWYLKWIDPCGTNPDDSLIVNASRPFAITTPCDPLGYRLDIGNLTILMLSDRNEGRTPAGRFLADQTASGGRPAGAIMGTTEAWWETQVEDARANNRLVITAAHHMLRETTSWTGDGEGCDLHNCTASVGDAEGSSYLYYLLTGLGAGEEAAKAQAFETYLAANPGSIDFWLGGHTHADPRVADGSGRTLQESKWGVEFLNVASLTRYHVAASIPRSVLLTFTGGSTSVRVRPFWHSNKAGSIGWDTERQATVTISRAFVPPGV